MKKRFYSIILISSLILINQLVVAQSDTLTKISKKSEKQKKGWNVGGIPALSYDSDLGLLYGVILNIYDYGDGSKYPKYNNSIYFECSRTTKGSGKNTIEYDNRTLLKNTRIRLETSYLTEQALDFYGYNGYNSYYGRQYLDKNNSEYISRLYYRYSRELFRGNIDLEGKLYKNKWRWLAGASYYNMKVGSVDIHKLNEKSKSNNYLPDTASLYDKYVEWKVIPENEKNGGITNLAKVGIIYDSRDNEASPQKGIWAEALLLSAPKFIGNKFSYSKLLLTYRQFVTIVPKKLVLAYRVNYQGLIGGEIPFYMMPLYFRSKDVKDGLGGGKTLRGILRNRVVGDGTLLGNIEFRYCFFNRVIFNQNFSITASAFTDAAKVVQKHRFDKSGVTASYGKTKEQNLAEMDYAEEAFHTSYGVGLHFAFNHNFIVAMDYGMAGNPQDGKKGLYIAINYIF